MRFVFKPANITILAHLFKLDCNILKKPEVHTNPGFSKILKSNRHITDMDYFLAKNSFT